MEVSVAFCSGDSIGTPSFVASSAQRNALQLRGGGRSLIKSTGGGRRPASCKRGLDRCTPCLHISRCSAERVEVGPETTTTVSQQESPRFFEPAHVVRLLVHPIESSSSDSAIVSEVIAYLERFIDLRAVRRADR